MVYVSGPELCTFTFCFCWLHVQGPPADDPTEESPFSPLRKKSKQQTRQPKSALKKPDRNSYKTELIPGFGNLARAMGGLGYTRRQTRREFLQELLQQEHKEQQENRQKSQVDRVCVSEQVQWNIEC